MSKRTLLVTPCSLFVAALSLSLGACDAADGDAADAAESHVVTADLALAGGAIDRLGAEFHVLDAASLDLSTAMSAEEARQRVAGVDAVGIDLGKLDRADVTAFKALSQAAMEEDVPVIVEDVAAEELAQLIGVGVEADVAVITSLGPNSYRVLVFGGGEGGAVASAEGEGDELLESPDDDETPTAAWSPDTVSLAVERIGETLRSGAVTRLEAAPRASLAPTSGYLYYDFDMAEESWSPVTGQTASLSMDFEAELALDSDRAKKVLFLRPTGSGQHPGTLISDGSTDRGYYQESQKVSLAPNNTNVSLYAHAPATANASTTYTSSTGYTIGSEGGWPLIGYSVSDETTTTLSDFSMVNNTSGSTASWTFSMTSSWSSMYSQAAFEKCKVKSLPALAKSNLNPEYEVYYRASDSFTSSVTFSFAKQTLFRRISRGGDIFTCKKYSSLWTVDRSRNVSIDFGAV